MRDFEKSNKLEKKRKKEQYVVEEMIMLLYHPFLAVWHAVCSIREKGRKGTRKI